MPISLLIAQTPRVAHTLRKCVVLLPPIFECELNKINIKATTTEHLGFNRPQEGLAAYAVVLLDKA